MTEITEIAPHLNNQTRKKFIFNSRSSGRPVRSIGDCRSVTIRYERGDRPANKQGTAGECGYGRVPSLCRCDLVWKLCFTEWMRREVNELFGFSNVDFNFNFVTSYQEIITKINQKLNKECQYQNY